MFSQTNQSLLCMCTPCEWIFEAVLHSKMLTQIGCGCFNVSMSITWTPRSVPCPQDRAAMQAKAKADALNRLAGAGAGQGKPAPAPPPPPQPAAKAVAASPPRAPAAAAAVGGPRAGAGRSPVNRQQQQQVHQNSQPDLYKVSVCGCMHLLKALF